MQAHPSQPTLAAEPAIRELYARLLDAWNRRSGKDYAAECTPDAELIGFDGYQHAGRETIESDMQGIFDRHATPHYVYRVRSVRLLTPEVAYLRAVTGLIPDGQTDINPALNAVQCLVAVKRDGRWLTASFQNTPAQFHGRPDLAQELTDELRAVLKEAQPEAPSSRAL